MNQKTNEQKRQEGERARGNTQPCLGPLTSTLFTLTILETTRTIPWKVCSMMVGSMTAAAEDCEGTLEEDEAALLLLLLLLLPPRVAPPALAQRGHMRRRGAKEKKRREGKNKPRITLRAAEVVLRNHRRKSSALARLPMRYTLLLASETARHGQSKE